MARIALIDPSGRAATTVRAVLGRGHEIVVRSRIHAPGDAELIIADLRYADMADPSTLRGLTSFAPVLVLVDRREPVPPSVEEGRNLSVLRKPFDAFELRLKVEQLLRNAASPAERPALPWRDDEEASWLEFPYVPAPAGAVLRRAAKLAAPLWVLGEPGCGRRRIALAVCRIARAPLRAVTLFPDERLDEVLARESNGSGSAFALIVPEVEERSLLEQERLALILSGPRGFRLIATSIDDPADRVMAGTFSRNLYRHLIGLAVQISPLRERPIAIPPLAQTMGRRIARSLGSEGDLSFSPDAMAKLQTYMWPGNLVELEAVLTRTLASLAEADLDGRTIEDHELLFTPDDLGRARPSSRAGASSPPSRLPEMQPDELPRRSGHAAEPPAPPAIVAAATGSGSASARAAAGSPVERSSEDASATFETLLAGLAHDLRNPMTAIKTFADMLSSDAKATGSASELSTLASEACSRLAGYLEALQRYAGFGEPRAERLDALAILNDTVADRDAGDRVRIDVAGALAVVCDREQLRFVLDNLVDAALAEVGERGVLVVAVEGGRTLTFGVTAAQGAVTKLRRLGASERQPASWRVVLARAIARRNGCEVDVEASGDGMKIRCRLPGGEVGTRGKQTSRIDR
jgi:DNA-binding NtrC family response regulator